MKYLKNLNPKYLKNKTCLLRIDLNIKDNELRRTQAGKIHFRIESVLPTIKFLIRNKAKIVILSHRGQANTTASLQPFAKIFFRLLKKPVHFIKLQPDSADKITRSKIGSIFLLENLRFFKEEMENNKSFAKKLAGLGDIYINDAFAVCHRRNASVAVITKFIPSYTGFVLEKEIKNLNYAIKKPEKPLVVILGGDKILEKIRLLKYFTKKADFFLLGGLAVDTNINSNKIILPSDFVLENKRVADIGAKTIENYKKYIKKAKTIVWNGPLGKIENQKFRKGNNKIIAAVFQNKKAKIIIGGGQTISALQKAKPRHWPDKLFLSTGGGAMLEYLAGKKLPGIEALNKK